MTTDHDPLRPHAHDPNPTPPSDDSRFRLRLPDGREIVLSVDDLRALPTNRIANCFIVSTGHGTSGPFNFGGATLANLIAANWDGDWAGAAVISGDGFGTRLTADEVLITGDRPVLLVYEIDGRPLERGEGLVRLIVPSERDDALRQVKWIGEVSLY